MRGTCTLALALLGCGYALVRPDNGGPVPALSLGQVRDLTVEGDLGQRLVAGVGHRLAGRARPRIANEPGVPVLQGALTSSPERTVAYDIYGAAFELALVGRLELVPDGAPAGPPLWSSGDVTARTLYARGPNATATEGNRRVALLALVDELSDRLAEHFLESPELPK